MSSHAQQGELYARLEEVLGREPAETLMTMLPRSDQYATKSDLSELRTVLQSDMSELRTELKHDLSELRTEFKSDFSELRQDMRELRGELRSLTRTFVVAQMAAMVGLTGIFIGVNQLL